MNASVRRNSFTTVLLVLVLVMGLEIVYLVRQNRRLQDLAASASLQVLEPGQTVPTLLATDLDGHAVTVRYGRDVPTTVLIWFSPSCHVCEKNASFWNALYDFYGTSGRLRFLAMSDSGPDETRSYVAEHGLRFPVVSVTDESLIDAYNGRVLPQTALISPRGGIIHVWPGALDPARQGEITAALDSLTT